MRAINEDKACCWRLAQLWISANPRSNWRIFIGKITNMLKVKKIKITICAIIIVIIIFTCGQKRFVSGPLILSIPPPPNLRKGNITCTQANINVQEVFNCTCKLKMRWFQSSQSALSSCTFKSSYTSSLSFSRVGYMLCRSFKNVHSLHLSCSNKPDHLLCFPIELRQF
jgi:hypothetical protein